ncbi:MAG TPA: hypothetical protein ENF34_03285 [Candidatus Bathyarchaeota archaeon]|nr:MAG: hypothetical protein DRO60_03190 [Candidatus Bathyarchaeota archaeon]HDJ26317.1 hypothetical protein [Candidatus Bathyarchaeota archaeon]
MSEDRGPEKLTIRDLMRRLGILLKVPKQLPERRTEERPEPRGELPVEEEVIELRLPGGAREPGEGEEAKVIERLEVLITKKIGELREEYGDIMVYGDFVAAVVRAYADEHGEEISIWDVEEAVKHLAEEGIIAGIFTLPSGARIIRLSPKGFGKDELKVLEIASTKVPPELTVEELAMEAGWPIAKAEELLKALEEAKVARHVPGSYAGEQDKWYFPGLERREESEVKG